MEGDESLSGEAPHRLDRPIMRQQWREITYLHWRYDPGDVQALLPRGLEVDTFDGSAWVGLVPFRMVGIAFRFTPPIPYFGSFPETNVRTYVRGADGPGVWFHSLDITRLVPVLIARLGYRLPYMWSRMSIESAAGEIGYSTRRRWPGPRGSRSRLRVRIGERIPDPEPLEHFLTARWRLYTMLGARLAHARVEHEAWPLYRASAVELCDELVAAAGYAPPPGPPHVLYSPGVSVRVERPRLVEA